MSLLFTALYAKCPYIQCFICKVSLLLRALYAKYPYCVVLYVCKVSVLFPYYVVLYTGMQRGWVAACPRSARTPPLKAAHCAFASALGGTCTSASPSLSDISATYHKTWRQDEDRTIVWKQAFHYSVIEASIAMLITASQNSAWVTSILGIR